MPAAAAVPTEGGRAGAGEGREAVPRQQPHAHVLSTAPPSARGQCDDHAQQHAGPRAASEPAGGKHRSLPRFSAALLQSAVTAEPSGRPLPPQFPRGRVRLGPAVFSPVIRPDVVTGGVVYGLNQCFYLKKRDFCFFVPSRLDKFHCKCAHLNKRRARRRSSLNFHISWKEV